MRTIFCHATPFQNAGSCGTRTNRMPRSRGSFRCNVLCTSMFPINDTKVPPALLVRSVLRFLPPCLLRCCSRRYQNRSSVLVRLNVAFRHSVCGIASTIVRTLHTTLRCPLSSPSPHRQVIGHRFFRTRVSHFLQPRTHLQSVRHRRCHWVDDPPILSGGGPNFSGGPKF